jgi:hypothetical protein
MSLESPSIIQISSQDVDRFRTGKTTKKSVRDIVSAKSDQATVFVAQDIFTGKSKFKDEQNTTESPQPDTR